MFFIFFVCYVCLISRLEINVLGTTKRKTSVCYQSKFNGTWEIEETYQSTIDKFFIWFSVASILIVTFFVFNITKFSILFTKIYLLKQH